MPCKNKCVSITDGKLSDSTIYSTKISIVSGFPNKILLSLYVSSTTTFLGNQMSNCGTCTFTFDEGFQFYRIVDPCPVREGETRCFCPIPHGTGEVVIGDVVDCSINSNGDAFLHLRFGTEPDGNRMKLTKHETETRTYHAGRIESGSRVKVVATHTPFGGSIPSGPNQVTNPDATVIVELGQTVYTVGLNETTTSNHLADGEWEMNFSFTPAV